MLARTKRRTIVASTRTILGGFSVTRLIVIDVGDRTALSCCLFFG
jgi:hypothetical protein